METIGLIAAMPLESRALINCIKGWTRLPLGLFQGARLQQKDRNCCLITSGMGLKRAIDATATLLALVDPSLLISFGIAGAVNDDLQIGDVIIARNTCLLEKGMLEKSKSLAFLSEAALKVVSRDLQLVGARLVPGTAITTRGSQISQQQLRGFVHPILDMVTAGVAQVAAEMGIPLLSIRSISDRPRAPIPFNIEAILDEKDNLFIGNLLMMVLRRPKIIFNALQMLQNSNVAADHVAKVVVVVLSQSSPVISSSL
jgi:adenosylhomocysteine nucleosidase